MKEGHVVVVDKFFNQMIISRSWSNQEGSMAREAQVAVLMEFLQLVEDVAFLAYTAGSSIGAMDGLVAGFPKVKEVFQ